MIVGGLCVKHQACTSFDVKKKNNYKNCNYFDYGYYFSAKSCTSITRRHLINKLTHLFFPVSPGTEQGMLLHYFRLKFNTSIDKLFFLFDTLDKLAIPYEFKVLLFFLVTIIMNNNYYYV